MRIHTDKVDLIDIRRAQEVAHVVAIKDEEHGSRKRRRAWEIILSGDGAHRTQYADRAEPAATWDQWGIFLAELFKVDPDAIAGPYDGADQFHEVTGDRFRTLRYNVEPYHRLHRWNRYPAPDTQECRCGAVRSWRHLIKDGAA
jgi:hypothetical protein